MRPSSALRATLVALPLLLWGSPAAAQYTDPDGSVVVEDLSLVPGQSVRVSGSGFDPLSEVEIWVFSDPVKLATVTADGDGAFSVLVTIPASVDVGTHTLQSIGKDPSDAVRVLSTTVTVSATGASGTGGGQGGGGSSLPRTGAAVGSLVLVGGGLVVAGSITARRSRRA